MRGPERFGRPDAGRSRPRGEISVPQRSCAAPLLAVLAMAIALPLSGQERLTLEEALLLASARSPSYAQAEMQLENAHESRRTAWGALLPSASFSSSTSASSSTRFDPVTESNISTTGQSMSGGLNLGYDLFTGGRQRADLRRSEHDLEAADARLHAQRFQVILQTKQTFFNALRQGDLLAVAESRVERAEESLELVRRRVEQGSATASDSLRARLELANARQSALQTRNQLRAARVALARQVGLAGEVDPVPLPELEPAPLSLPEAEIYRIAEEASPGVRAAEASSLSARAAVSSARASYLPSVRMSSGYNWSNQDWALDGGRTSWSVSLSASYPIFNGFAREANYQRAQNQVRLVRLQEEDARLQARQEVDGALQSLRTAEEAARIADEAVALAREDLRIVRERYDVGVATIFDVVTSQVALDQAEADRVQTRYDLLLARAQLEAIVGREL